MGIYVSQVVVTWWFWARIPLDSVGIPENERIDFFLIPNHWAPNHKLDDLAELDFRGSREGGSKMSTSLFRCF